MILLILHLVGMAFIVGPFFMQMKYRGSYDMRYMLIGAWAQVITGIGLVGVQQATKDADAFSSTKIAIKFSIAVVVLVALLIARSRQKKLVAAGESDRKIGPFFHTGGGLALINVIVAVVWP
jgi:cytochrome bd-type quinol oxidase subunit 2